VGGRRIRLENTSFLFLGLIFLRMLSPKIVGRARSCPLDCVLCYRVSPEPDAARIRDEKTIEMCWNPRLPNAYLFLFGLCIAIPAQAITIDVNFATGTLFSSSADFQAKATISAAAADISTAITTSLNAITTDIYVSTNASTTVTFDWSFNYDDPSTGSSTTIEIPFSVDDSVTVFVGTRSLLGSTLGSGGPAGSGLGLGVNGFPNQFLVAANDAESQSEAALSRGGGPVISTVNGSWDFDGVLDNYSVDLGISYGALGFDIDADDNGTHDSEAALNNYWHWDHTSPVASGKNDLYSVAVHEILHSIGFGTADSWDSLVSGTTWNGSEVQAITGTSANLISSDGGHVALSVMSQRLSDGMPQEVAMDPNITTGSRKELTVLDLAFLRDIGYETITPTFPSPPDFNGDGDVDAGDLAVIQSGYGINGSGDSDSDLDTDGADFLVWQRSFTGPLLSAGTAAVPEPSAGALLFIALLVIGRRPFVTRHFASVTANDSENRVTINGLRR